MRLNDVWRNVENEIGIYTRGTFDNIPDVAGVYAWFYPLRIRDFYLDEFVAEIHRAQAFDPKKNERGQVDNEFYFAWEKITVSLEKKSFNFSLGKLESEWEEIKNDENRLKEFRKAVLKASLLMPPMYVGKTSNLYDRTKQHLARDEGFHKRFEDYAEKTRLGASKVSDLILVTIKTNSVGTEKAEDLVEELLKRLAKPSYSKL